MLAVLEALQEGLIKLGIFVKKENNDGKKWKVITTNSKKHILSLYWELNSQHFCSEHFYTNYLSNLTQSK